MKRFCTVLLVVLTVLFATACSKSDSGKNAGTAASAESSSSKKDTLIVALDGEPQQLDPYAHSNQNGIVVSRLVYEPLLRSDLDGNISPWLATE